MEQILQQPFLSRQVSVFGDGVVMKLIVVIAFIVVAAFADLAQAQQSAKMPRVAYLSNARFSEIPYRVAGFRQGLRELGYMEGKNIVVEWREGTNDQVPALVSEVIGLKVDVIVAAAGSLTRAVKAATSTVPVVMAQDSDPVGNGFVTSLSHPGGNVTGLSTLAPELNGKKLEILKEVTPGISRVAVFVSSNVGDFSHVSKKEVELAAAALRLKIHYLDVLTPADFENAFKEAIKGRAHGALMEVGGPVAIPNRKKTAELAVKSRLPVMYRRTQDVEAGGLMTYGVNIADLDRRAATYVDKILKGAKPANLPIEQPKKFELIINLKAAKQIGLMIPPTVLARADRVIR